MTLDLRDDAQTALLVATSMGVRLTPAMGQPVHCSDLFRMQATSAETNVASVASFLGLPVTVLTALVRGSPIARFISDDLARRHMRVIAAERDQGGPWGYRHQFNLADSGAGSRGPRVANDRAGEVGRSLGVDDFDLDRLFGEEGVRILHLSGLIAALSPDTGRFCLELARCAQRHGTRVAFDCNHRASFWAGREDELRTLFCRIGEQADILIGNEEDFQLCFGIAGPPAGGAGLDAQLDAFTAMIGVARERFPATTLFATTLREVVSVDRHLWGALLDTPDAHCRIPPREIGVLDRIGGGDGFVGGLLYGLSQGWDLEACGRFAWASGALAATMCTDYAQPVDEDQIWRIWDGNARVRR